MVGCTTVCEHTHVSPITGGSGTFYIYCISTILVYTLRSNHGAYPWYLVMTSFRMQQFLLQTTPLTTSDLMHVSMKIGFSPSHLRVVVRFAVAQCIWNLHHCYQPVTNNWLLSIFLFAAGTQSSIVV